MNLCFRTNIFAPSIIHFGLVIVLSSSFQGCGYTILKTRTISNEQYNAFARLDVNQILGQWCGTIELIHGKNILRRDSINLFSINRDGTWEVTSDRGSFYGIYSVKMVSRFLKFEMHCSNSKDDEWNRDFLVYLRNGGIEFQWSEPGADMKYPVTYWKLAR